MIDLAKSLSPLLKLNIQCPYNFAKSRDKLLAKFLIQTSQIRSYYWFVSLLLYI